MGMERFIISILLITPFSIFIGWYFKGQLLLQLFSFWFLLVSIVVGMLDRVQAGRVIAYTLIGSFTMGISYFFISFLKSSSVLQNTFMLLFIGLIFLIGYTMTRVAKDKPDPISIFLDTRVLENRRYEKEINAIPVKALPYSQERVHEKPVGSVRVHEKPYSRQSANRGGVKGDSIGESKKEYDLRIDERLDKLIIQIANENNCNLTVLRQAEGRLQFARVLAEEGFIKDLNYFDEYAKRHFDRIISYEKNNARGVQS